MSTENEHQFDEVLRLLKEGKLPMSYIETNADVRAIFDRRQVERDAVEEQGVSPVVVDGFL